MWHWSGSHQTFGDKFSGAEAQVWTLDSIFPFVWSHDNKVNNNVKCISTSSVLYYGVCVNVFIDESLPIFSVCFLSLCSIVLSSGLRCCLSPSPWARLRARSPSSGPCVAPGSCQSHPDPQGGNITRDRTVCQRIYVVNLHISDIVNTLSDGKMNVFTTLRGSKDIATS